MLEIKSASQKEIYIIKKLIKESNLDIEEIEDYIKNCMVAYDNKQPVAAAGFIPIEDMAIIKFVVVSKNRRREYLGDGIVKAILNLADKMGIKKVFVNTDKEEQFFIKLGFKEVALEELKKDCSKGHIINQLNEKKLLYVALPDYFLKACKFHK
ncbi:GNAT family N-acetyltransferase [Crassaminicella indica]|uniref:GNAT family N-acetyltransferase n=1 Tax=Crassaminicella indica TaxID=2855394 RepID=A0ABX8RAH4_9CLOT|nr:GNAT family N-acetyltransferase [Crassaminicella indica]QXM06060.1 GNAT family N-acetyltransferase [Crassaminicella indica]